MNDWLPGIACSFLVLLSTCAPPPTDPTRPVATDDPVTSLPLDRLEAIREAYRSGQQPAADIVARVIERAEEELTGPVHTIVNKEVLPPSGDPHDYLTIGPYWWPDPTREDGLPWIRRDGEVNPLTRGNGADRVQLINLFRSVENLAYAAYFSDPDRYGERADELLRAFFLDPETRMNPHLNYGQGIPGRTTGRCFGIIETAGLYDLTHHLQLLDNAGGLTPATREGVTAWLGDYLDWLQTSALGLEEQSRLNNHAVWYDVQVMALLLYLDRKEEARTVAEGVRARIDGQIEADGSQPHELARTKSLSYSTMNLRGFTHLAEMGRRIGVDLWNYRNPDGGSLPRAYAFLEPYASGAQPWTHPQIGGPEAVIGGLREQFVRAGHYFGEPALCAAGIDEGAADDLDDLLYACE